MLGLDRLLSALFLLSLLLYLVPAVFRLDNFAKAHGWFQLGAILTLGIAMTIAVAASVKWFLH